MNTRRLCIIFDVAMLAAAALIMWEVLTVRPGMHHDVDRARFPVKGIDISAHNGDVDFDSLIADTVQFVIIKATEGIDFCDANFNRNYHKAAGAGLKVGAYHFFRFNSSGLLQTDHFLSTIEGRDFDLPLILDVEKAGNPASYDIGYVRRELAAAAARIREAGYPVMIYTNKKGWEDFIKGNLEHEDVWLCSLSGEPLRPYRLWQHSHKGKVRSVRGAVDLDTYNGPEEDFRSWARTFHVHPED